MKYKEYLKTDDWKNKKKKKLINKKRCGICASSFNIDIHHLNYKDLFSVENTDLRKLCRRCHLLTHKLYKKGKIIFTSNNHHSRFALIKNAVKKALGLTKVNLFKCNGAPAAHHDESQSAMQDTTEATAGNINQQT